MGNSWWLYISHPLPPSPLSSIIINLLRVFRRAALKPVLQRPSGDLDPLLVLLCPDPNQLYDLNDKRKAKHASFMTRLTLSVIPIKAALQPAQKTKN